jgi:hypothetical protein
MSEFKGMRWQARWRLCEEQLLWPVLVTKYYADDEIKVKLAGHLTHLGEKRGKCTVVVRKHEVKRPH